MSARFPSRWLSAAAVLAAVGLTSSASAQSPAPPITPKAPDVPQTAPAPPSRFFGQPLLLEEEQVSEHGNMPRAAPPVPAPAPRATRCPGVPECQMSSDEVTLRCLLFSVNPLAAFIFGPFHSCDPGLTLPAPGYVNHPPQYVPPAPVFPLVHELAAMEAIGAPQLLELLGLPVEMERLDVMPVEVEEIKVMPAAEESEPKYELLGPWIDHAQLPPPLPAPAPQTKHAGTARGAKDTQVMLNVVIAEVTGPGAKKLNLDRAADGQAPRWVIEVADEARQKALETGLVGLRHKGRAKLLAEPRLVTLSGHPASFLSGGEQAVPVPTGLGQVAVQFEEFGTRLNCLPVVLADGTVRLEVEPEISELCETANVTVQGTVVPGRSSQRVHTTADVAPGHALVISGPKAGGNLRLVVLVTPSVIEPPAETDAAREQAERRIMVLMNQSENIRQIEAEMQKWWMCDQPTHLTPERVHGGVAGGDDDTIHELLEKRQRELSRGHYAAAEDLAQQALTRNRKEVQDDPLVCQFNLLQRVKAGAVLPLGSVSPCESKPQGRGPVAPCEDKAIGSDERMVEALMQEYNAAYKEGRYLDAAALAERVLRIDPDNAVALAAANLARMQAQVRQCPALPAERLRWQAADAMLSFQNHFKQGRYEEAKAAALQALSAAPDDARALAALQMASAALSRQPHPAEPPQCPYVAPLRPLPQPADPAVVNALQKILIDRDKGGPAGGAEEAEPKAGGSKPLPRR
jgi:tetratricopeptide (TPR) repeat protein